MRPVRIGQDRGGRMGPTSISIRAWRSSGEMVIIDGVCLSACTIVLGSVPHDRICVTSRAKLGFHAAWNPAPTVVKKQSRSNAYAVSMYPSEGAALDRPARRAIPTHDFPERPRSRGLCIAMAIWIHGLLRTERRLRRLNESHRCQPIIRKTKRFLISSSRPSSNGTRSAAQTGVHRA